MTVQESQPDSKDVESTVSIRVAGVQSLTILAVSTSIWLFFLIVYLRTGTVDAVTFVILSVTGVSATLAYFRVFHVRILCVMLLTHVLCWSFLPEYSMSLADKIQAIWNLNRIGFGGVTVMTFVSMLSGVGAAIWPMFRCHTQRLPCQSEDPEIR